MFIKEIKLAKAEKFFNMRAERRREELAVTFIPYKDKKYWTAAEWAFMLENIVIHAAEGFYIRTKLFAWGDDVSKSNKTEEADKV